jgi:hypothetical protein
MPPLGLIRYDYHGASRILAADVARCRSHCIQASRTPSAYCKTRDAYGILEIE